MPRSDGVLKLVVSGAWDIASPVAREIAGIDP
jgi:hypothetical protein